MCHLVLFLPIFALPVFWFLPWPVATAIYVAVVALSAWLYYVVIKVMHRPSVIGAHTLLGAGGTVMRCDGSGGLARIGRELWRVESRRALRVNQHIQVTGRRGFVLEVAEAPADGCGKSESIGFHYGDTRAACQNSRPNPKPK